MKETQQSVKETVKEIKTKLRKIKQYKIVKAHSLNNKINWLTGIFLVLSIVLVGFIQAFYWLRIVYAICIGLVSVFLLGWKIYFIHKYISSKMSDIPSKIIVYLSKLSTTTLIIWGFLNITIFAFTSNFPDFIGWSLIAIIFVKVVILLYDFFCTSGFYKDLQENIIWLYVSTILVISLFSPLIKNEVVFGFYKGFLIGISLLLTALVLKRLLLDIKNLKGYSEVLYLIIICALTIFLTVYAIYTCCWVVDSQSQPLFSAITGIYAALLGGALTLGGVAWTIKSEAKNRQDDFDKREQERKEEEKKKAKPLFGFYTRDDIEDNGNVTICFEDSINKGKLLGNGDIEKYPLYVTAVLRNTEKATFTICRLFHTNQWWDIRVNKLIFAKGQMNFEFFCKEENDLKILEIEDVLGNKYYYQLKIKMDTNKGYKQQGLMRVKMYEAIGCDIVESIEVDLDFVKENIKE